MSSISYAFDVFQLVWSEFCRWDRNSVRKPQLNSAIVIYNCLHKKKRSNFENLQSPLSEMRFSKLGGCPKITSKFLRGTPAVVQIISDENARAWVSTFLLQMKFSNTGKFKKIKILWLGFAIPQQILWGPWRMNFLIPQVLGEWTFFSRGSPGFWWVIVFVILLMLKAKKEAIIKSEG